MRYNWPATRLAVSALIPNEAISLDGPNDAIKEVAEKNALFFDCGGGECRDLLSSCVRPGMAGLQAARRLPRHAGRGGRACVCSRPRQNSCRPAPPAASPASPADLDPSSDDYDDGTHMLPKGQRKYLECLRDAVTPLLADGGPSPAPED